MYNPILIGQVKRKLNITWEDNETDELIKEIIGSAIPTLKHKLGIYEPDFDFSQEGTENLLFKSYCLYEYNHCLNEFDDNYANEIAQIRAKWQVKYAEMRESSGENDEK